MFYIKISILTIISLVFFVSCDNEKTKNINLTVASKRSIITYPEGGVCFIVKYENEQKWSLFYNTFEGFDYQEGNEYVVNVKVTSINNPPMDGDFKHYKLNSIISYEEKESEGIPIDWITKDYNY